MWNWSVATPVIVGCLTLLGVLITVRAGSSNALAGREEAERTRMNTRINALEERIEKQESHSRAQDDYIRQLRNHIDQKLPPPPPPWPEELA